MCVLERVVQFLYEILQWYSGWWCTSGGQQEIPLLQPHNNNIHAQYIACQRHLKFYSSKFTPYISLTKFETNTL